MARSSPLKSLTKLDARIGSGTLMAVEVVQKVGEALRLVPRVETQSVNLSGIGTAPLLPAASLQFDVSTFVSQRQDHAAVSLASAPQISASGRLTLAFTPSVTGGADDPAVMFVATGGRNRSVPVHVGSLTPFYNGSSQFASQTGTPAGRLTFTLTFAGQDPVVSTVDILPAPVTLTASAAVWREPVAGGNGDRPRQHV